MRRLCCVCVCLCVNSSSVVSLLVRSPTVFDILPRSCNPLQLAGATGKAEGGLSRRKLGQMSADKAKAKGDPDKATAEGDPDKANKGKKRKAGRRGSGKGTTQDGAAERDGTAAGPIPKDSKGSSKEGEADAVVAKKKKRKSSRRGSGKGGGAVDQNEDDGGSSGGGKQDRLDFDPLFISCAHS